MSQHDASYASKTYASGDPLRNFSHRNRFDVAEALLDLPKDAHVLDFGGGDGAFLDMLHRKTDKQFDAVLYEPHMHVLPSDAFIHVSSWEAVHGAAAKRPFDVVVCQEVMEHFAPQLQDQALARIASVMAPEGKLLLSVPVELGPVALIKNLGRWKYRKADEKIYTWPNLLRSLFVLPIPYARSGENYLSHMGFYYTDFRRVLARHFRIDITVGSPFRALPLALNSQVFFRARARS